MKDARKPGVTDDEIALFKAVVDRLKRRYGRGIRDTLVRRELEPYARLYKLYARHAKLFDIDSQERWAVFSGQSGRCKVCDAQTAFKRGRGYADFCSAKCAGIGTNTKRKKTCRARYGVDHISMVPEVTKKRSESLRAVWAAKGHGQKRKGKFEYQAPKLRPNTGSKFYVYALLDPRKPGSFKGSRYTFDHEPFYIGKGKGGRAFDHLRSFDVARSSNPHKKNKIRKIVAEGLHPIIRIVKKDITEEAAFELESRLIHSIGCGNQGPLTNVLSGGDGFAGYTHTKTTKKKLSELSKLSWKQASAEQKQERSANISLARGGIALSEYRKRLKGLPYGKITVPTVTPFRISHSITHSCKCGNVWDATPSVVLRRGVGCVACKRCDPVAKASREAKSRESKAKRNLPMYLQHLQDLYHGTIKVHVDESAFTMRSELKHTCSKGHTWYIRPRLFMRYQNGCPYCMTHTTRTAKQVLLNVGHI